MVTILKTTHEEKYSNGSRILGVLLNYSIDVNNWTDSFTYIYNTERKSYIFFNTMVDMFDYVLYNDKKTKRAYMIEKDFDTYYDSQGINGKFGDILKWL